MKASIRTLLEYSSIVLIVFVVSLEVGVYAFSKLDIEAYPFVGESYNNGRAAYRAPHIHHPASGAEEYPAVAGRAAAFP